MNTQARHTRTPTRLQLLALLLLLPAVTFGIAYAVSAAPEEIVFDDVKKRSRQFIDWERSIQLTAAQEAVKKEALSNIPAPCCSDNSAYTCCCPCNLSLTVWGMAKYMITEQGATADQVRARAQEWFEFVNPNGFSGDVCYEGGCGRAFHNNGCGGMNPAELIFD